MAIWLPFAVKDDGWYGETAMKNPVVGGDDHVMGHKLLTFHLIKNTFSIYERFEFEKIESGWTLTKTDIRGGSQTSSVPDETFEEYASIESLSIIFNETGEQKIKSSDYAVGDRVDIRTYMAMEQIAGASLPEVIVSQISDLSSFKGKVSTLESTVSGLTADKGTLEGKVSTLESDNSTLNATVSTLESDNASLSATVSGLEANFGSLSSANDTLNSTVSTLEGNVTTLTSDKEALEGQVSTLESTIADLTARLAALEAKTPE